MRKMIVVAICIWLSMQPPAFATESPPVTARWGAPESGSPVVVYELRLWQDGELVVTVTSETVSYTFAPGTFAFDTPYTADVRGVDAKDRAGPWSEMSPPYIWDPGPPSMCGPMEWIVGW